MSVEATFTSVLERHRCIIQYIVAKYLISKKHWLVLRGSDHHEVEAHFGHVVKNLFKCNFNTIFNTCEKKSAAVTLIKVDNYVYFAVSHIIICYQWCCRVIRTAAAAQWWTWMEQSIWQCFCWVESPSSLDSSLWRLESILSVTIKNGNGLWRQCFCVLEEVFSLLLQWFTCYQRYV